MNNPKYSPSRRNFFKVTTLAGLATTLGIGGVAASAKKHHLFSNIFGVQPQNNSTGMNFALRWCYIDEQSTLTIEKTVVDCNQYGGVGVLDERILGVLLEQMRRNPTCYRATKIKKSNQIEEERRKIAVRSGRGVANHLICSKEIANKCGLISSPQLTIHYTDDYVVGDKIAKNVGILAYKGKEEWDAGCIISYQKNDDGSEPKNPKTFDLSRIYGAENYITFLNFDENL